MKEEKKTDINKLLEEQIKSAVTRNTAIDIIPFLERYVQVRDLNGKIESLDAYILKLNTRINSLGDSAKNAIEKKKLEGYVKTAQAKQDELKVEYKGLQQTTLGGQEITIDENNWPKLGRILRENDPQAVILKSLCTSERFELIVSLERYYYMVNEKFATFPVRTAGSDFVKALDKFEVSKRKDINLLLTILADIEEIKDIPEANHKLFVKCLLSQTEASGLEAITDLIQKKTDNNLSKEEHNKRQKLISDILKNLDEYDLYNIISTLKEKNIPGADDFLQTFMQSVITAKEPELIKGATKVGGIAAGGVGGISLIAIAVYCITNHTEFAKQFMSVIVNAIAFPGIVEALREAIITSMPNVSQDLATAIAESIGVLPTVLLAMGVVFAATSGVKYTVDYLSSPELDLFKNEVQKELEKSKEEVVER